MAGDRRVGGVGEADLGQADATPAQRAGRSARTRGRKPSIRTVLSISRVSSVLTEPPITFEPRPEHGDRGGVLLQVGEQGFLGGAAGVSQRDPLARRRGPPSPGASVAATA